MIKGVIGGAPAAAVAADKGPKGLTPPQKAAIIISALGPEGAEPLLRQLKEDSVRAFARAAANLGAVPPKAVEATVKEFLAGLDSQQVNMGPDRLKLLLAGVLSPAMIDQIMEEVQDGDSRSVWEKLSNSDSADLTGFLSREHPQTVAVVMSRIRPEVAAKVMARLETEFAGEVVMRLSKVSALGSEVMDAVRDSLEGDFLRGARLKKSKRKPDELIGSIFNFMPNDRRDALMSGIEAASPALALAVQRKMFTFTDVPKRVDRANVSVIVRGVDNAVLVTALAAAKANAPETKEFFLGNMSRRLAEQFAEQIEELATPNARDGEEAQFAVVGVIRRLAESGEITLVRGEEEEPEDEGF